jgi:hypothetical protein
VPVAVTLNVVLPPEHILAFEGSEVMVTGIQLELTVTVTVKVLPTQVPEVGVTV